jgi:hypothetical protein
MNENGIFKLSIRNLSMIIIILILATILTLVFVNKDVRDIIPFVNNNAASEQSLNRKPSSGTTKEKAIVRINASFSGNEGSYSGKINEATSMTGPHIDQVASDAQEMTDRKLNNPESEQSLFVLEVLAPDDKVLLSIPISTAYIAPGDDVVRERYDMPGEYSGFIALPKGTNSISIRIRGGKVLDRIYFEDWEPSLKFVENPDKNNESDEVFLAFELLPKNKTIYYVVYRIGSSGNNLGLVGGMRFGKGIQKVKLASNSMHLPRNVTYKVMVSNAFHVNTFETPN